MVLDSGVSMLGLRMATGLIAASLTSLVCFNDPLIAKPLKPFRVANWSGHAIVDDQTKQLTRCSASSSNARGISISYSLNSRYEWALEFSNPAWSFSPGFAMGLTLRVNDQAFPNQRVVFLSDKALEVQLSDSVAIFEMLHVGRQLQVQARGLSFDFDLNDNDDVLFALVDCVDSQTGRGRHSKPISRSRGNPKGVNSATTARDPTLATEAKLLATQIIALTQISASQVVTSNEAPGQQFDAAWKVGSVLGTVEVFPSTSVSKTADLAIRIVSQEVVGCRGKLFAAAGRPEFDSANAVKVVTSCRSPETTSIKYHLGVPRHTGGYYVLAASDGGVDAASPDQRPAKVLDNRVAGVITQVLAKLKQRNGENSE